MAIKLSVRKDWLSGTTPVRQYEPADFQGTLPTFTARQGVFQTPETPKASLAVTPPYNAQTWQRTTPAKMSSVAPQSTRTIDRILPSSDNPEAFARGINAATEQYQPTRGKELTANLSRMAEQSTARKNRQTGLQFQSLLGGQTTKGVSAPKASPTQTAWFDVMSDSEKTRAAQIKNPVERGEFINSLNLNDRAVSQLRQRQDETAARLETKARQAGPLRPTDSIQGLAIANYIQAGNDSQKRFKALKTLDGAGKHSSANDLNNLSDSQKETILILANSGDYKAISDYFNAIEYKLMSKSRATVVEKGKTLGYEHPVYSVVPEGASNAFSGIPAIMDTIHKKYKELRTGEWTPIDPNSSAYNLTAYSQAISEGANERISEIQNQNLQGLARIARSGTSSALTNGLQLLAGGAMGLQGEALSNFTLAVMGTSAAGQTAYRKLKDDKATSAEALTEGLVNGFIEVLTEKVSLDHFIKSLPSLRSGDVTAKELAKQWMKTFAVQGSIEGLEEVAGNIADQTWDIWYNGNDSEYSRRAQTILTQKILDNGGPEKYSPTPEDVQSAREQAFTDCFVTQSVDAFLSAVFSSFLLTGVPTATSRISSRMNTVKAGNYLKAHGQLHNEINKANMFPESKAAEAATALMETASQKGERNVSGYQLGKLALATNYEVYNLLADMAQSDNTQVAEYAVNLLNSPEIHSARLTPAKLEEILRVRREGFVTPDTVPATASETVRATAAEAERVQTENPEATVLNPIEQAVKRRFDGMGHKAVQKRAAIIQKIISGKDVTKAQFNSIDPTNAKTKEIMQELTQLPIRDGLTGDALYQEYRAIGMAVNAEPVLDIPDAPEAFAPTAEPAEPVEPALEPIEPQAQEPAKTPESVESPEVQSAREESRRIMVDAWNEYLESFLRRFGRLSADNQIIPSRSTFETAYKKRFKNATDAEISQSYEGFIDQTRSIPIGGEMYNLQTFSEMLRKNRQNISDKDIVQRWKDNVSLYLQDGLDAIERMRQGQEQESKPENQQETKTPDEPKESPRKKSEVTYTPTNQPIKFHWAVVPVGSLIISHDEYGNRNPDFPAELQPRDRMRASSQEQISGYAQNLNPMKLGDSGAEGDRGAPIIREDGTVVSGNARSAAIRAAYQRQNDSGRKYANYIHENAERFGLDPRQIPDNPVLVRVAEDVSDWAQLAKDLNTPGTASLSATETAFTDVDRIAGIIELLQTDEEGNLNSASNRDFINAFVATVPQSEHNYILEQFGEGLNKDGISRLTNAILAYAYGDSELVTRISESTKMTRITNALVKAAPKFAKLRVDMQTGEAYDIPVIQAVLDGLRLYSESLKNRSSVVEIADQASLDTSWDANTVLMAEVMEQFKASAAKLNLFLQDLEQAVRSFGVPNQTSLLGGTENATLDTAIDRAVESTNKRNSDTRNPTNFQRRTGQFGLSLSPAEDSGSRGESQSGRPDGESNLNGPAPDVRAESAEERVTSIPMDAERNPTLTGTLPNERETASSESGETLPEGVGAASYAFHDDSVAAALDYATEIYGHNKGEKGRRQLDAASEQKGVYINDIPAQVNDDTYVGQNVISQLSAPGVAKERISDYELGTVEGYFNQNPLTHKEMLDKADAEMRRHGGAYGSRDYLLGKISKHEMLTLEDIALFQKTLVQLSHTDMSTRDYITFAADLNDYASYLGHGLNLLKLLQKLDPDFEMNHAQRQIGKLNEEFAEKGRKRAKNQNTPDNEKAEQVVDEARDEVLDEMEHPEKAKQRRRRKSSKKQSSEQAVGEARDEVLDDDFTQRFVKKMRERVERAYQHVKPTTQEQQAMKDLLRIAEGYDLPKRPARKPRTAIDRLRAFYGNRQQFLEAWTAAQNDLRSTYENDGESGESKIRALDGFLNKNFGYVAPHERATETGGTVQDPVTAGVLSAILHSDPGIAPKDVSMRAFLRDSAALEELLFNDVARQIQDFRDETGTERHIDLSESDQNDIRAAIREYIFDTYHDSFRRLRRKSDGTIWVKSAEEIRLDNDIRAAIREAGLDIAKIIRQGNIDKIAVARQINDLLLKKYGVSFEGQESAGEIILRQFNAQVAQRAQETLEKMFREKSSSRQLTANQDRILKQFTELANMGAFTSSDYHAQAAAKIFGYDYIVIDPALIAEFRNATTDAEKDTVIEKIQQNVADQIPATFGEKFTALQYIGMLGSLKTIISRNMGGNLVFQPVVATKNAVAAGIESVAKALGFEIQKTRTVTYRSKDYQAWADDFGSAGSKHATAVRRMIMQGGKYSDESTPNTFMQGVQEKRTIFGRNNDLLSMTAGRVFEWSRRTITDVMDWGDAAFARHTYAATAARYLRAQGYTFENAPESVKNAAREIAVREAAEATYRDNNQFSEMVSQMFFRNYRGDSKAKLFVRYLGQGILPFRKTPANVAVRAFEYSPFGIIKSGVDTATKKFGANRMTGNDLINEWSKALTGTGLFILGMILKRWGLLGIFSVTGTGPLDDKKKRGFMQLGGWQAYSIRVKIGNRYRYYNADWMAPEAIPVFLGANLAEALEDDESPDFWEVAKIAMTIGDPIIKMSMLSGVNEILTDSASYGDTEYALSKLIVNAAWSGFAQVATPQALLQLARAANNTRQTTFVDKNSNTPSALQRTIGGIPFAGNANRRDYIDEWGRTQENYVTPAGNFVAQFLSPSYQSIEEIGTATRRMEQELTALYDRTGVKSVLPTAAKTSFNLNGVEKDMTKAEFLTYATRKGQSAHQLMLELTSSPEYNALDDAQKISAVEKAYEYADGIAKLSIWGNAENPEEQYTPDKWIDSATILAESGIPVSTFVVAKALTLKAAKSTVRDSDGKAVEVKVHYQKAEQGTVHQKTSTIGSSSIQAALEIRQTIRFTGSDANKKYKQLFEALEISESVRGKSEQYLQQQLHKIEQKGRVAP